MNGRWFAAYSFLLLAIHEAHELAHAVTARAVCGVWPVRDFNAWRIPVECASWAPTAAGPLFSYLLMAVGGALVRRASSRWGGVALIFAANPFARIFTAVMGGGDEMVVGQRISGLASRTPMLRVAVIAFVTLVCGAAIVAGWRSMAGMKRRVLWFVVVLVWPMVLTGIALFVVGNRLLRAGVLALPLIGGAPLLVIVVSAVAAALAALTHRWLLNPAR